MKARVYGWAVELTSHPIEDLNVALQRSWNSGTINIIEKYTDNSYKFLDGYKWFTVHQKQIEPIKEITITEEDFDKVCEKFRFEYYQYDYAVEKIKEELFKDIK